MANKNVVNPTSLFSIFEYVVTLHLGGATHMNKNLKGELAVMDGLNIKPNYAALAREYGMDWRTIKKYHEGYKGKPSTRNKGSKLDEYKQEIADKLSIHRVTVYGVYKFMVRKYGISRIGTYSNFNKYVTKNKLKAGQKSRVTPDLKKSPANRLRLTGRRIFQ